MLKQVTLFSDGACRGNPGVGGWGVLLAYKDVEKELWGAESHTTNNRMELMAVIRGLEALKADCEVMVTTDSQYVRRGITEWIKTWRHDNWRTANKRPVKNQDLWKHLDEVCRNHKIAWHWVKGHSGVTGNERADQLANQAIDEFLNK